MLLDNKKLFNTILHAKVINSQLEIEYVLSCLGVDSFQTLHKPLQAINRKYHENRNHHENRDDREDRDYHKDKDEYKDRGVMPSSIGPLILQFTQLEESNFKNQFFVARSSFQVIHLFHVLYYAKWNIFLLCCNCMY